MTKMWRAAGDLAAGRQRVAQRGRAEPVRQVEVMRRGK